MRSRRERRFDEGGRTLADVGESALLAELATIARRLSSEQGGAVLGPGDDAAIWRPPPGRDLVVSQDCLVEGIDFRRQWIQPFQLGRRALAVALSDLAGMGARPSYCLATLCAPGGTGLEDVLAIQEGLCEAAANAGCTVVGGDVSDIVGPMVIEVSAGGTIRPGAFLRRNAGAPGDALLVTGVLGRAAAGLALLQGFGESDEDGAGAEWIAAQLEPAARLEEGAALVAAGIRCGGDLSDGLLAEAGRTAAASRCGAELWMDTLPVDASLPGVFPSTWLQHALGGGEDFELLAAVSPQSLGGLRAGWDPRLQPLTMVGRLVTGSDVRLLERDGGPQADRPPVLSRHYR